MENKKKFEEDIESLLSWESIYDKFDFPYLKVMDRYAISWFIVRIGNELKKKGYKIKYHEGIAYKIIEKEIEKTKEQRELEMYREKYPDFKPLDKKKENEKNKKSN